MAEHKNGQALGAVAAAIVIGAAIAWAGSDGGDRAGNIPVFALCGALAYAINWLVFIPSAVARTERYYDLTGGLTYISTIVVAVLLSAELDLRAALAAAMVLVWSVRLATFLFRRISRDGRDSRFDDIKTRPLPFLMAWTLQGLWVLLTAAAALVVITGGGREPLGAVGLAGLAVWAAGFAFEIVADRQKSRFKADPANKGKFIATGLWAWSRHPNYFGEIVLWTGMALVAVPVLQGWQWIALISPVFVTVLLTTISGVPPLEKQADERWGGQEDYEDYKRRTPVLIPKPPTRKG
jgi:steroid 5-alpha reductase family enzyme